jgi:hypothetical protein
MRTLTSAPMSLSFASPLRGGVHQAAKAADAASELLLRTLFVFVLFYLSACLIGGAIVGLIGGRGGGRRR